MANRLYIGTTLNFFFEGANNYAVNPCYLDLSSEGPNIYYVIKMLYEEGLGNF